MIEKQSLAVDSVTGATVTSSALKAALADAVTQAKGDVKALSAAPAKAPSTEVVELSANMVVVGGGSAGLSAALAAEQDGLSVILLEKNAMLGGHTALSGGFTIATGARVQRELGVTDDTFQKCYDDMMKNGGDQSIPELLKLYVDNMGVSTDWTIDYVGAGLPEKLTKVGENSVDRVLIYKGAGAGLMDAYAAKVAQTTVQLLMDTRATKLLTQDNEVIGVEGKAKDGTTYQIKAKATVLATGGYGARRDLLPESLKNYVYYGASLSSGDGLAMGQEVGADTVHMGFVELFENGVEWLPGIAKSTYNGSMAAWTGSGILVDRAGKRVVNERSAGTNIVAQQAAQPDATLFLLMDQATYDIFSNKISGTGISQEMLQNWLDNNGKSSPVFANGKTIEEVAAVIGSDAAVLKETIERYNSFVEKGVDEDFGRPADYMKAKIGEGPYYLVEQKPRYATTLGGLKINTELQVINVDGEVIKGLYSAGDTAGGVRGNDSIPGADVGWAITSGYLIGKNLAKELKAE